uniref:Putative salivary lipocalin n=1 Tax=Amblyomma americanum TaxID=6943 RepID=A0A0C9SFE8_AMBAM
MGIFKGSIESVRKMMFTLLLCLSMMAMASASNAAKTPYEEDSKHFNEQTIESLANITEKLVVLRRNFNITTNYSCLSAQRINKINATAYQYKLQARAPNGSYISHNETSVLSTTGNHTAYNAATYVSGIGAKPVLRKLMTKNKRNTCFVLVETRDGNQKACQLLLKASKIHRPLPTICKRVYKEQCLGESVTLYDDTCL